MSSVYDGPGDIRDLSYPELFILWVVRTTTAGPPDKAQMALEFIHVFGAHAEGGGRAFEAVLRALAKSARPITFGRPGYNHLTHDEQSLLALCAAAQAGDDVRCRAHARWMMGRSPIEGLCAAVTDMAVHMERNGRLFRVAAKPVTPTAAAVSPLHVL